MLAGLLSQLSLAFNLSLPVANPRAEAFSLQALDLELPFSSLHPVLPSLILIIIFSDHYTLIELPFHNGQSTLLTS